MGEKIWFHPWCECNISGKWIACDSVFNKNIYNAAIKNGIISPCFHACIILYRPSSPRNGIDGLLGRKQGACLQKAGFARIQLSASYDCWTSSQENTRRVSHFLAGYCQSEEFKGLVLKYELFDQQMLKKIAESLHKWGNDPNSFAAEAWTEALSWKES